MYVENNLITINDVKFIQNVHDIFTNFRDKSEIDFNLNKNTGV